MSSRRVLALTLATVLSLGWLPALAQQAGTLAGTAVDEAEQPYSDYAVQIRNVATGQIAQTTPLNATGQFNISNLELNQRYLVELLDVPEGKVVCTEGPYHLQPQAMASKTDIDIECGKKALWLLLAAPAIGLIAARSPSGL